MIRTNGLVVALLLGLCSTAALADGEKPSAPVMLRLEVARQLAEKVSQMPGAKMTTEGPEHTHLVMTLPRRVDASVAEALTPMKEALAGSGFTRFLIRGTESTSAEVELASAEDAAKLESLKGFPGATWGMSLAQVKAGFKGVQQSRDGFWYLETKTAGVPSLVLFRFVTDKLNAVMVKFDRPKGKTERDLFEGLCKALAGKYGESMRGEEAAGSKTHCRWLSSTTRLDLSYEPSALPSKVTLLYQSTELGGLQEAVDASDL